MRRLFNRYCENCEHSVAVTNVGLSRWIAAPLKRLATTEMTEGWIAAPLKRLAMTEV
jgi:hypothetical protein